MPTRSIFFFYIILYQYSLIVRFVLFLCSLFKATQPRAIQGLDHWSCSWNFAIRLIPYLVYSFHLFQVFPHAPSKIYTLKISYSATYVQYFNAGLYSKIYKGYQEFCFICFDQQFPKFSVQVLDHQTHCQGHGWGELKGPGLHHKIIQSPL